MNISRAGLIRGAFASTALLPAAAFASSGARGFRSDEAAGQPHAWTDVPRIGGGPLRFAVIGDHTGVGRPGVFDQAMVQLSWLEPDFVLSVGDLIEGYTEDRAKIARQWAAVEASVAKLDCPFLYALGNHDVDNAETLDAWRERRGAPYYSFTYKGALFLVLNTEDPPTPMAAPTAAKFYELVDLMQSDPDKTEQQVADRIAATAAADRHGEYSSLEVVKFSDRQLGWARDVLARHPKPLWTFVVLHKPAWKMQSPDFAKVRALLAGRPHTVFAGHTHYFTHEVFDGHDYINMGTTGGIRQKNGPGTMDHTMVVTLGPPGPIYANTRFNGLMNVGGETGQNSGVLRRARNEKGRGSARLARPRSLVAIALSDYSMIFEITPAPTVRPPSRMAKRWRSSIAIGVISSTFSSALSPGMIISTPSLSLMTPVTSVVRK